MEDPKAELEALVDTLDTNRGCLFESSYEFPGRYARWTMGFATRRSCWRAGAGASGSRH